MSSKKTVKKSYGKGKRDVITDNLTKKTSINAKLKADCSLTSKKLRDTKVKPREIDEIEEPDDWTKLYDFMCQYPMIVKTDKETGKEKKIWTHVLMYAEKGMKRQFNIPENAYSKFLRLYANALCEGHKLHITEQHKKFGPIVIDLDFAQSKRHPERKYTNKTILNIVRTYNMIIKKYLDVNASSLEAYVYEKKQPNKKKRGSGEIYYGDGLHIIYPHICTLPSLQFVIREDFIKIATKVNLFSRIPLQNDIEDVVDKNVILNSPWALYGSTKNPKCDPYKLTHVYRQFNGKLYDTVLPGETLVTRQSIRELVELSSCRRFFDKTSITDLAEDIDTEKLDKRVENITKKISKTLSKDQTINAVLGKHTKFTYSSPEHVYIEAQQLTLLLSKERSDNTQTWLEVGMCLHNIDNRLLADWIKFSKLSSKFKSGECEEYWKKFRNNNMSIASLHYFASKDNNDKYLKLKENNINELIRNNSDGNPRSIAKIVIERKKHMFKCASVTKRLWYEFKNHKWVDVDSAYSLRNFISDEITVEYSKKQTYLYELAKNETGHNKDRIIYEASAINKIISKLNDPTFKDKVIRECADMLHDPHFMNKLDENINLIGFTNGVYDLQADMFRDGCPDDYISMDTEYDYLPLDKDDGYYYKIKKFLKEIQPNKACREYMLTILATCLGGSTNEQSFYIWIGKGANGKSTIIDLIKHVLGKLFKTMAIEVLVGKRACASNATPELADKKGVRLCPFDEPNATDKINLTFFKIITGNDTITGRELYGKPIYFKPQLKPILLCNVTPRIKVDSDGTCRRPKILRFGSKFLLKYPKNYKFGKNEYPADKDLSETIHEWKQTFAAMLIKQYRKYKEHGIREPESVTAETNAYLQKCDTYMAFLNDCIEKADNPKEYIKINVLFDQWRNWHRRVENGNAGNASDLRDYLKNKLTEAYNPKLDGLVGYKIKAVVDDVDACINALTI